MPLIADQSPARNRIGSLHRAPGLAVRCNRRAAVNHPGNRGDRNARLLGDPANRSHACKSQRNAAMKLFQT